MNSTEGSTCPVTGAKPTTIVNKEVQFETDDSGLHLSLQGLSSGVYYIQVSDGRSVWGGSLVKE